MAGTVVVLAGGTGGAKLARGMLDVVGDELVVIANTADDVEIYNAHVSPDPDLVTYWLADRIDERGWGLRDDTFHVMDGLREQGVEVWFNLGDRDLALGLRRAELLGSGVRLTATLLDSIGGLRCVDCGLLEMARITEALTALMISVNARYKTRAGVRITGLPTNFWPQG